MWINLYMVVVLAVTIRRLFLPTCLIYNTLNIKTKNTFYSEKRWFMSQELFRKFKVLVSEL